MTRATSTAVATAMLGLCVAGLILSVTFGPGPSESVFGLVFVAYAAVGWSITRRQSRNRIGWLLLAFGAVGGANGTLWAWHSAATAWGLPGARIADWSETWLFAPMIGLAFGPLLALFPDGQLLSPRWRVLLWLSGAFVVLAGLGNALFPYPAGDGGPNPYAVHGFDGILRLAQAFGGVCLMLSVVGGVAALVVRYRRAGQVQRQQLKWFLAAAALLPLLTLVGEMNDQALQGVAMPFGLALLAAAIGIAILRHGLYDIDRIISRTVGWALVTVVIAGVYLGAVTVLTALTAAVAGESPAAVAAATLLAAAAFKPARSRIQAAVDRRFNRARYDTARLTESYRNHLRDELELDSIGGDLVRVAHVAVQPRSAVLWLRDTGVSR